MLLVLVVELSGLLACAGGNAYFGQKPTHELMVRWTQLNALMPALQFSIAPWDLSEETARLCAEAVALRKKVCHCTHGAPVLSHQHST